MRSPQGWEWIMLLLILVAAVVVIAVVVVVVRASGRRSAATNVPAGQPSGLASGPPPGWYPDQSGQVRYWDGTQWTGHVQS